MKSKLLLALVLLVQVHLVRANLLVNGSFEAATNGATLDYISLSPGSTNIPGWTTTNAEITLDGPMLVNSINPVLSAADGNDFLDLSGGHDAAPYGGVFQTVATAIGQRYQVAFEIGSDKYWDSYYAGTFTPPVVSVSLNGLVVFSATNDFPSLSNYWQRWSFQFTASAANTTLTFTGANSSRVAYLGLDNVTLTVGGPPLEVALSGMNSVVVVWPSTGGYTLQTNDNLSASGWIGYNGAVTTVGGTNTVSITPPTGSLFFRLYHP